MPHGKTHRSKVVQGIKPKGKPSETVKQAKAEQQRLRNIRNYSRAMAKWSDWANNNLTLKQKAEQRQAKENELLKKYGFKK